LLTRKKRVFANAVAKPVFVDEQARSKKKTD